MGDDKKAATFTPGPWAKRGSVVLTVAREDLVATVGFSDVGTGQQQANARLIAQAPAMFALLKRAVSFEPDDGDLIADMKACLAAVEGK